MRKKEPSYEKAYEFALHADLSIHSLVWEKIAGLGSDVGGMLGNELIDLIREEHSAEPKFLEVVELAFDSLGQGLALMLRLSSVQVLE